jgi:shikimate dehydrogenase
MITGAAKVAGVVGWPVAHSLSPLIHNAWIDALGLDAVSCRSPSAASASELSSRPFERRELSRPERDLPSQAAAFEIAERPRIERQWRERPTSASVRRAIDVFATTPMVRCLIAARDADRGRRDESPACSARERRRASGAARSLRQCGKCVVAARRAEALRSAMSRASRRFSFDELIEPSSDARLVINATSAGLNGEGDLPDMSAAPPRRRVHGHGLQAPSHRPSSRPPPPAAIPTVDGLAMLIGQARPSFEAFFGVPPPPPEVVDVRALCLAALGEAP